jgi:hypothetical protein
MKYEITIEKKPEFDDYYAVVVKSIYQTIPPSRFPKTDENVYYSPNKEDAVKLAQNFLNFDIPNLKREVSVRPVNPKDLSQLHWEVVADKILNVLSEIVNNEVFCYDVDQYGQPDFFNSFGEEVSDHISETISSSQDTPMSMGWVGSDGLP